MSPSTRTRSCSTRHPAFAPGIQPAAADTPLVAAGIPPAAVGSPSVAAGTPPFAVGSPSVAAGIPLVAAGTPPSGGPGLDRPPFSTCPVAPSARRGTALSRPHRPAPLDFLASAATDRGRVVRFPVHGSGTPFGGGSSSQTSAPGARRANRPSALPSRGAARATQRVRLDRQVRCKRTSTGVRAHSGGVSDSSTAGGAGRPSPKRRICAMNPNANEKQGARGLQSTPGDAVSWRPRLWERVRATGSGRDGPHEPATRGGGPALGQHAVRHGADRPARGHPTRRDQHLRRRRRSALRGPPRPRNCSA